MLKIANKVKTFLLNLKLLQNGFVARHHVCWCRCVLTYYSCSSSATPFLHLQRKKYYRIYTNNMWRRWRRHKRVKLDTKKCISIDVNELFYFSCWYILLSLLMPAYCMLSYNANNKCEVKIADDITQLELKTHSCRVPEFLPLLLFSSFSLQLSSASLFFHAFFPFNV